jgi:phosphodiesterase/alkaline phosphatase D-like protein
MVGYGDNNYERYIDDSKSTIDFLFFIGDTIYFSYEVKRKNNCDLFFYLITRDMISFMHFCCCVEEEF